jgi:hypothetical protein
MRILTTILLLISLSCFGQQSIPLDKFPSIANIVRGEDTKALFDNDFTTVYNPTSPSWVAMYNPVVTEILVGVKASKCIPRQLKYVQQTGSDLGTKMYFVNKATKEKVLAYTFNGQGGYMPDTWRVFNIPDSLQFDISEVILEAQGGGPAYPAEVQLLGDYTPATVVLKDRTPLPLSNLLGFVCYPWNTALAMWPNTKQPFDLLRPSRIRVYDDYANVFDGLGNVSLHWDQFNQYNTLKRMGVQVKDCIQNHPDYPYALGDTRLDPATYLNFARALQRYAVANRDAGYPVSLIQAENELDRSWKGPQMYMDGYALAAFCSACYDGHKGKYFDAGVKQVGGPVKFVNPGCATDRTQILYQMLQWTIEHRGYRANGSVDFPFDVYELHWYQSLGGQYAGKPGGMPPELVIGRVQEIIDFFRRYCPEMEINIGEYGLDTHPDSDLNAPAFGPYGAQQSRGIWTIRDLLWFAMMGIDAADWYRETMDWIDDPNYPGGSVNIYDNVSEIFSTMDLVRPSRYAQPADYTRRIVGDYFRQISDIFRHGYIFDGIAGSASPYVFRFKKLDGSTLYAVWTLETVTWPSDGSRATITENRTKYAINVKGTLYRFVDGADAMSTEPYNGDSIVINSKPVFIVSSPVASPLPVHLVTFTAQKINQSAVIKYAVQDAAKVEVERSTDGTSWSNLGEGIFNKLVDAHPLPGKNFYRLKMYNQDGSFTYSFIIPLQFGQSKKVRLVNSIGQTLKQGSSDNIPAWKSELRPGVYIFIYDDHSEKFIKQR